MEKDTYRDAFERAKDDYDALLLKRNETEELLASIDADLIKVRRGVIALAAMCGEDLDEMNLGLTDSLRTLFNQAPQALDLQEILKGIVDLGYDLSTQKNPRASIMAVLKRLQDAGEVRLGIKQIDRAGGKATVRVWVGKNVK